MKRTKSIAVIIVFALSLCIHCNIKNKEPQVAFYFWKTSFSLSETEKQALTDNQIKTIYIRYFDIDINPENQKPIPVSPIIFKEKIENIRFIPVVYIKNRVLLQKNIDMKELAEKVFQFISQINIQNAIQCNEIQIDCDWTIKSRENYFRFLHYLKLVSKTKLSATIRLHQVKYYHETKIPEVDHGVLMYYNMGNIDSDSLNSIYDRSIALKYLNSLADYPLLLDVALPVFSWGVHIRNDKVIGLISKLDENSLKEDSSFIKNNDKRYIANKEHIKFGTYFKTGDEIKMEITNLHDLKDMASDLSKKMRKKPNEVIFYDLDSMNLTRYNNEKQAFKKIANYF